MDERHEIEGSTAVLFEDNLGGHKTEMTLKLFALLLKCFAAPRNYPKNFTFCKPIDRHIGKMYKVWVYRYIREKMFALWKVKGTGVHLSAKEKRILITQAVGKVHNELCKEMAYARAFDATGTWLPIDHCTGEVGQENGSGDSKVSLQHYKKLYNYSELCTRSKILKYRDEMKAKEAAEAVLSEDTRLKRDEEDRVLQESLVEWSEKGADVLHRFTASIHDTVKPIMMQIAGTLPNETVMYVVGSWPAMQIAKMTSTVFGQPPIDLCANDIDIFLPAGERQRILLFNETYLRLAS